jgi:hypothetical protein
MQKGKRKKDFAHDLELFSTPHSACGASGGLRGHQGASGGLWGPQGAVEGLRALQETIGAWVNHARRPEIGLA